MTKEKFQQEFSKLAAEVEKSRPVGEICKLLFVGRSVYHRWKIGRNAPIVLARYGAIHLMTGLLTELGGPQDADQG